MDAVAASLLVAEADVSAAVAWFGPLTWAVVVVAVAGLLLIYPALILRKYVRIMMNMMDDRAPAPENGGNGGPQLADERVSFQATDGHPLEGAVLARSSVVPRRGLIVFAHEVGSDRASGHRYFVPLLAAGYDVFAFDFRGHGASPAEAGYRPRQWPSDRERADMRGAIAFIASYLEAHGRSRDVGLFGVSRGGGSAILASEGLDHVRAIVVDGAFCSDALLEYLMQRFATIFARIRVLAANHPPVFWRFLRWLLFRACRRRFGCRFPSVRKALSRVGAKPVFFIHGEKDSYVPVAQSQFLYDRADGPKELWIVPRATHNQGVLVEPDAYAQRVVRFFDEHLAGVIREPARRRAVGFEELSERARAIPV